MIPVIILDPSSLTLHFHPMYLAQRPGGEAIFPTFELSYGGMIPELKAHLSSIDEPLLQSRCAHFATCVWHEKRHFLDFLLSNYGALRIRQYFQLYGNLEVLFAEAKYTPHPLWFPLDTFSDPIRRQVFGIGARWETAEIVAENMRGLRNLVAADRHAVGKAGQLAEVGGEAQFEALAWICQIAAAQELLGEEFSQSAQRDMARFSVSQWRYRWIEYFAAGLGILPHKKVGHVRMQDVSFVMPLLYASLQIRGFGQGKTVAKSQHSSLPSRRLYALAQHIKLNPRKFQPANVEEGWDQVNALCRKIWGRTALSEMKHDFEREAEFLDGLQRSDAVSDEAKICFADYHHFRGVMIEALERFPSSVLDPVFFARNTLPRLQPYVIWCRADGIPGKVPKEFDMIHGFYDDPKKQVNGWWWAASPRHWPTHEPGVVALEHRNDWLGLASNTAPVVKLMMNGRAHRTMIGPELLSAEQRLRSEGFEVQFDPALAYPREDASGQMEAYYILRACETAVCDTCKKTISKPEGRLLPPWLFRHNTLVADFTVEALTSGGDEEAGRRRFWRDWSPWVCCDSCFAALMGVPSFQAAFEATCS